MGTTSQKIQYLGETKSLLKDSINSLGGEITSQTTFRQYATELDSIYSKLPKVSGTGSTLSLSPTLKGRLGSVLKGNTLQDGTPTPDSPVEIQSATGLQKVSVGGKNLFTAGVAQTTNTGVTANYNESEIKLNGTTSRDGNIFYDSTLGTFNLYRKIGNFKAGNYIISFKKVSGSLVRTDGGATALYIRNSNNKSVATLSITEYTESSNYAFTLEEDTTLYVQYFSNKAGVEYTDYIFTLQLEKGSTATDYEPYQTPQEYEINLGTIKLNKIGDYQDYITGTPYNWFIKRQIGSVVLDGTETWYKANENINVWVNNLANSHGIDRKYTNSRGDFVCNYFSYLGDAQLENLGNAMSFNVSNAYKDSIYIQIDPNIASSNSELKSWLSTHNTIVDYVLATETTEPITNTELISQLNAFYNAKSYNGQTNISIEGDLPMILSVSALKGDTQ